MRRDGLVALLRRSAPPGMAEDVLGDLEKAHRKRVERHGPAIANLLTSLEALDMAFTLMRSRPRRESKAHHRGIGASRRSWVVRWTHRTSSRARRRWWSWDTT